MEIETLKISELKPYPRNARTHNAKQIDLLVKNIKRFGFTTPILIDGKNNIIAGHGRLEAIKKLNWQDAPCVRMEGLSEAECQALRLADNKIAEMSDWDMDLAIGELKGLDNDLLDLTGFDKDLLIEPDENDDVIPEVKENKTKLGDLYILGKHRLLCGDATKREDVERLMDGRKADMVFTDPPYGIKKDIENDNLNIDNLVEFNGKWIQNATDFLKDCGYFFIWGYFQVLAETWTKIIKPLNKVGFRNFIVWKKRGKVQGINAEDFRMFPPSYEACLMFVWGQQFGNGAWSSNPNSEFYWEGYEPIRMYLDRERKKMGWDIPEIKKIVGHSDSSRDHWFNKSQWAMPTEKVYKKFQQAAKEKAFGKQYDDLRKQYDELRKQYDELRGYFDNTHGLSDVWEFEKISGYDKHPTVKPIEVCQNGIIATTKENDLIVDLFGGSGSTLIASEKTNRVCYMQELDPHYCDVIVQRYVDYTGNEEVILNGEKIVWQKSADQRK